MSARGLLAHAPNQFVLNRKGILPMRASDFPRLVLDRKTSPRVSPGTQIIAHVQELHRGGRLHPGEYMPSETELAAALGINRVTVHRAYVKLTGILEPINGVGWRVTARTTPTWAAVMSVDQRTREFYAVGGFPDKATAQGWGLAQQHHRVSYWHTVSFTTVDDFAEIMKGLGESE